MASDVTTVVGSTTIPIGQTNASYASNLQRFWSSLDFGSVAGEQFGHPKPFGPGFVRTGGAITQPRIITGTITSEWNTTNPERKLLTEANDTLPGIFMPHGDVVTFTVTRKDTSGNATSRFLTCEVIEVPHTFDAARVRIRGSSYGWIQWDVVMQAAFPFWSDTTATTEALALTNLDATTTNPISWTEINNTGAAAAGMKVVLSAISNTLTSVTITNSTLSETCTWSDAAFANTDFVDFGVDDPTVVDWTAGNTITAASNIQLRRGTNNGTIQGTGSSSPAATATLSYRLYHTGF